MSWRPRGAKLGGLWVTAGAVAATLLLAVSSVFRPSPASAFDVTGCDVSLESLDRADRVIDAAAGGPDGGAGGTFDDPLIVDYGGSVRFAADTGDTAIWNATWRVDVFLVPTGLRGSGANAEGETSIDGAVDVSSLLPFPTTGLVYVSGELSGEGGSCRGAVWLRIPADPPAAAGTVPFWIAVAVVAAGVVLLWLARPRATRELPPTVRRQPVLGALGGAVTGLGLGLLLISLGVALFREFSLLAALLAGALLGALLVLVIPVRSRHPG